MKLLLVDENAPDTRYYSPFWTAFSIRNGAFTVLDRLRQAYAPTPVEVLYFHPDEIYETLAASVLDVTAARKAAGSQGGDDSAVLKRLESTCDALVSSKTLAPKLLFEGMADTILDDFRVLSERDEYNPIPSNPPGVFIVGDPRDILIHQSAQVSPGVVFDSQSGPIIIDADARIGPFSFIQGPVSVGKGTYVDNCRVLGPTSIGMTCRVGGEIEASIIGDFSNKHHEGFLGHSIVGKWVNLGALVTTSDLKNNYGEVRLNLPESQTKTAIAAPKDGLTTVNTELIKFGSIISDCAKVAIGTMLNTGTVIGPGSNVFGGPPGKFLPPFSWGTAGETYQLDRFHRDCATIFGRRKQTMGPPFIECTTYLHQRSVQPGDQ
jgi:glucose-1-phosphate thymidylyltransferase